MKIPSFMFLLRNHSYSINDDPSGKYCFYKNRCKIISMSIKHGESDEIIKLKTMDHQYIDRNYAVLRKFQ